LRFEDGLSVTAESLEFNVLGMGHEFWIAAETGVIIALAVLAEENHDNLRILHLEVAPLRKKTGVGTGLLKAIIEAHPRRGLLVIPFDGTEDFYRQVGFSPTGRWEMKRDPSASSPSR
jgi:predicted N-acetyltransferase YhbS